jgi:ATP-binding cassette subfamily B protein
MSERALPSPVSWVLGRHVGLLITSICIMVAAPYLGSLPVRTIPAVVSLASETGPRVGSGELELFLGDRASDFNYVLVALIIAGALSFGLALLNTRVAAKMSSLAARDLRLRIHELMLARPPSYLGEGQRANMARNALINQSRVVASYATNTLPAALGILFAVVIWSQTLFIAVDSPGRRGEAVAVVGGVVAILLVVNLFTVWIAGRKSQASQRDVMREQGAFIGLAGESVNHIAALQLNVARDAQQQRLADVLDSMSAAEVRVATWSGLSAAASGGVVMLGIPLLVVAWRSLGLESANLAVMIPALLMLQRSISSVGSLWTSRKVALPSIQLVADLFDPSPTVDDGGTNLDEAPKGRLRFDDVHWSVAEKPILKGVTLDVAPAETVALVGAGGCGKSTLLRLALRILEPSEGTIRLDDTDVASLSVDGVRSRIGMLDQFPAFFDRTIRENLALDDRTFTDEQIAAAAEVAHFSEVIDERGIDLKLSGGTGKPLSGSQKRRLAITRLLLRDPDVILIDEIEAGLPQAQAQAVFRDIRAATADKTCLMVTHRPDLLDADRVAFVHEGCIVDIGTHAELEERNDDYRRLLAEQKEGDDDE